MSSLTVMGCCGYKYNELIWLMLKNLIWKRNECHLYVSRCLKYYRWVIFKENICYFILYKVYFIVGKY